MQQDVEAPARAEGPGLEISVTYKPGDGCIVYYRQGCEVVGRRITAEEALIFLAKLEPTGRLRWDAASGTLRIEVSQTWANSYEDMVRRWLQKQESASVQDRAGTTPG